MSAEARGYAAYPGGHAEGYPDTFVQLFRDFYEYVEAGDFSAEQKFPNFRLGMRSWCLRGDYEEREEEAVGWVAEG